MLKNDDPNERINKDENTLCEQIRLRQQIGKRLFIKSRPDRQRKRNDKKAVVSQSQNVFRKSRTTKAPKRYSPRTPGRCPIPNWRKRPSPRNLEKSQIFGRSF